MQRGTILSENFSIAIFCSDEPHHLYLVETIARRFKLSLVVVEPGRAQLDHIRSSRRRLDYFMALYHRYRRKLLGLDRKRRSEFTCERKSFTGPWALVVVPSINDDRVLAALGAATPSIVVVMGTSILGRRTLAACPEAVVNIHGGYLPDYRGNHCIFFARYHDRLDRIGSTIHFVDEGIDTGDIVEVVTPAFAGYEQAETLYCRAEKLAIERLGELLVQMEHGTPLPRQARTTRGKLYRTRDRWPWHDLLMYCRLFGRWCYQMTLRRIL